MTTKTILITGATAGIGRHAAHPPSGLMLKARAENVSWRHPTDGIAKSG